MHARSFDRPPPSPLLLAVVTKGGGREEKPNPIRKIRNQSARLPFSTAQYFLPKKDADKLNDIGVFPVKREEGNRQIDKLLSVGGGGRRGMIEKI